MDSADFDHLARSLVTRDAGGSPMDADRFDAFTRSLTAVAPSRRRLLTGVAGASLAALATALGFARAGAANPACVPVGEHCTEGGECCSSVCKRKRCRAHNVGRCTAAKEFCATGKSSCGGGNCWCFQTTGGANFCGVGGPGGGKCFDCSADAQCAIELNTPGAACVLFGKDHCACTGFTTRCEKPCKP